MRFMKVSREQFERDSAADWDAIILPKRATSGSAGYDFFAPTGFTIAPGEELSVPTGIRAKIDAGWVLMLFPRSGLGFKYRLMLNNTVGVVDSDYFGARNEGHIFIRLYNGGNRPLSVAAGEAFAQGVFLPFGVTEDDHAEGVRIGGFGSTGGLN